VICEKCGTSETLKLDDLDKGADLVEVNHREQSLLKQHTPKIKPISCQSRKDPKANVLNLIFHVCSQMKEVSGRKKNSLFPCSLLGSGPLAHGRE